MFRRLLIGGYVVAMAAAALALAPAAQAAETEPQWYQNGKLQSSVPRTAILWNEIHLESKEAGEIHCMNVMNLSIWNEGGKGVGQVEGWGTNACLAPTLEELLRVTYEQPIKEGKIKSPITVFATSELPTRQEFREGSACKEEAKTKLTECEAESEREPEILLGAPGVRRRTTSFPWKMSLRRTERAGEKVIVAKIGNGAEGKTCYPLEGEHSATWEVVPAGCVKITVVCPQVPAEVVFYGVLEPTLVNGVKNGLSASRLEFEQETAGELVSSKGEARETTVFGTMRLAGEESLELLTAK